MGKPGRGLNFNTKEIALISVLSSLWIVSQIYLGPIISQTIHVHGVTQRFVGWLLMLVLAELTGKFGRVSIMAAVAAFATRMVRRSASLYIWMVGLGYALGGLMFDLLFFMPFTSKFEGRTRKAYLLIISLVSGALALVPYLFFKLYSLGPYPFIVWIPTYAPTAVGDVVLNVLGTLTGLSILPRIKAWSIKIRT